MMVESMFVLCPLYIWVGFMGGGSYVNVLHGIRELKTLTDQEKESAMSLTFMFNDSGILVASIFSIVLGLSILKVDVPE